MATGTVTLRLSAPTLALTGTYAGPAGTDVTDDTGGRIMAGGGYLTFTPANSTPPATQGVEYDVAVALPTPTLVDGRAT